MMMVRGVRGATTVAADDADLILSATEELMRILIQANGIEEEHVASVIFTTTPDLTAAYPARAAREIGWQHTALMGMQEMNNPNGIPLCIRVCIYWNTEKGLKDITHVYMNGAEKLRPDFFYPTNKLVVNKEEVE